MENTLHFGLHEALCRIQLSGNKGDVTVEGGSTLRNCKIIGVSVNSLTDGVITIGFENATNVTVPISKIVYLRYNYDGCFSCAELDEGKDYQEPDIGSYFNGSDLYKDEKPKTSALNRLGSVLRGDVID